MCTKVLGQQASLTFPDLLGGRLSDREKRGRGVSGTGCKHTVSSLTAVYEAGDNLLEVQLNPVGGRMW